MQVVFFLEGLDNGIGCGIVVTVKPIGGCMMNEAQKRTVDLLIEAGWEVIGEGANNSIDMFMRGEYASNPDRLVKPSIQIYVRDDGMIRS